MTEAEALRVVVGARVKELWSYRSWYRSNRWATWTDLRAENIVELRALIALTRAARDLAKPSIAFVCAFEDAPVAAETEAELREAWGR